MGFSIPYEKTIRTFVTNSNLLRVMKDKQTKKTSGFKKFLRWLLVICLLAAAFIFWWKYYFVFGEGVKSGELNYVVRKGNLFKTYEGKLIQSGIRSQQPGSVQSYEFEFS